MNIIEIWSPKWSTNSVLVATRKIQKDNYIRFTKAPAYKGLYYISGEEARRCPITTNGKIPVFDIKMEKLTNITENPVKESIPENPKVKPLSLF